MTEPITAEQALKIARLARIAVSPQVASALAADLSRILSYVDQLRAVDTEGILPLNHPVPLQNVTREDVPGDCLTQERALAAAPETRDGFFFVPAVLENSGS